MNEINLSCAPADRRQWNNWTDIDWVRCEAAVQKLQGRIVKAQKEGRPGKVKALQWTLTHSFYAKALAVNRVTSNKVRTRWEWIKFSGLLPTQKWVLSPI